MRGLDEELRAAGELLTVRPHGQDTVTTDGPYAETKEVGEAPKL